MDRIKFGTAELLLAGFFSSNAIPLISSASRSPTKSSQKGENVCPVGTAVLDFTGSLKQIRQKIVSHK